MVVLGDGSERVDIEPASGSSGSTDPLGSRRELPALLDDVLRRARAEALTDLRRMLVERFDAWSQHDLSDDDVRAEVARLAGAERLQVRHTLRRRRVDPAFERLEETPLEELLPLEESDALASDDGIEPLPLVEADDEVEPPEGMDHDDEIEEPPIMDAGDEIEAPPADDTSGHDDDGEL